MMHKAFNLDGTPDFTRWVIQCDLCPKRSGLFGVCPDCGLSHFVKALGQWLIPQRHGIPVMCDDCVGEQSATLIDFALYCPSCKSNDLHFIGSEVVFVACTNCGSFTYGDDEPGAIDGWFINPPF